MVSGVQVCPSLPIWGEASRVECNTGAMATFLAIGSSNYPLRGGKHNAYEVQFPCQEGTIAGGDLMVGLHIPGRGARHSLRVGFGMDPGWGAAWVHLQRSDACYGLGADTLPSSGLQHVGGAAIGWN
jgi:hypothetical protein